MTATTIWRFGRRNEFADAIRQIERNAGITRGRVHSVWGPLLTVLLFGTLLFVSSVATAAADMRGDQFITMMDGNMLSGRDSAGVPFNLYFLPGGHATYTGRTGTDVEGTWRLDQAGHVCVRWPNHNEPMSGCFVVTVHDDQVTWRQNRYNGGTIVKTFLITRATDDHGHVAASDEVAVTR
jgi:hypothetical protein